MPYRILLAEESPIIQKVVEGILEQEGFEIKTVSDGDEAFQELDSFTPHIVLASSNLRGMDGYELCKKIKIMGANSNIPVILLAGAYEPYNEEYAWIVGVNDFILKPFESSELIGKVKNLLNIEGYVAYEPPSYQEYLPIPKPQETAPAAESQAKELIIIENTASNIAGAEPFIEMQENKIKEPQIFNALPIKISETINKNEIPEPAPYEELEHLLKKPLEEVFEHYIKSRLSEELLSSARNKVRIALDEIAPKMIETMLRQKIDIVLSSTISEIEAEIKKALPGIVEVIIKKKLEKVD